jgi:hypothetical protein
VHTTLDSLPQRVVESRVHVGRHEVDVLVILLGKNADAETARVQLDGQIRQVSGVAPRVDVLAVADAKALAGIESLLYKPPPLPPPAPPSPTETLESSRAFVRKALEQAWPAQSAGAPLVIDVGVSGDTLGLRVVHLGQALDAPGREALERSLTAALGRTVSLTSFALPATALTRTAGEELRFIAELAPALRVSQDLAPVSICVEQPPPATGRKRAVEESFASAVQSLLAGHPRVTVLPGTEWSVRFSLTPCPAPVSTPTETASPTPP